MDFQKTFNLRWGPLIHQKRITMGLRVVDISERLKIEGGTIRWAEVAPSQVPLCDLMNLLAFYGLTINEKIELCSIQIETRPWSHK